MSVISIKNISKSYGEKTVISDFSLDLDISDINVFMGNSGCGKTTLLRLIVGLEKPDSGEITGVPDNISFMFQEDRLLEGISAEENIRIVSNAERAEEYLKKVCLGDEAETRVSKLSGGMKRRVALARALAHDSPLVVLDEPFKGLDACLKQKMLSLVKEESKKRAVIAVVHEAREAEFLSGKTLYFKGIPLSFL